MSHPVPFPGYVVPCIGRSGLGNELFPWLRARELALSPGRALLPPRWLVPRLGPYLRKERDKREYFRLFRAGKVNEVLLRESFLIRRKLALAFGAEPKDLEGEAPDLYLGGGGRNFEATAKWLSDLRRSVLFTQGMRGYFKALRSDPGEHARFLARSARPHVLATRVGGPYLAVHVRLGDFARPTSTAGAPTRNNESTPLGWFRNEIEAMNRTFPGFPVLLCSDGSDQELAPLLDLPYVKRSGARNALDEIFVMAGGQGILGSRSTFSAWGAYLGQRPMLVAAGANVYEPHQYVFEARTSAGRERFLNQIRVSSGPNEIA